MVLTSTLFIYAMFTEVNWESPPLDLWVEIRKLCVRLEWEIWAIALGTTLMLAVVAGHYLQIKIGWRYAIHQYRLTDELSTMADRGEYRQVVVRMERAMKDFKYAQKMLGGKHVHSRSSVGGMSHLFTTCHIGWRHSDRYMPWGVGSFIQMPTHGGFSDDHKEPKWRSIAIEMSRSSDPILRCFGFWLLEDVKSFLSNAYAEAEKGNEGVMV